MIERFNLCITPLDGEPVVFRGVSRVAVRRYLWYYRKKGRDYKLSYKLSLTSN